MIIFVVELCFNIWHLDQNMIQNCRHWLFIRYKIKQKAKNVIGNSNKNQIEALSVLFNFSHCVAMLLVDVPVIMGYQPPATNTEYLIQSMWSAMHTYHFYFRNKIKYKFEWNIQKLMLMLVSRICAGVHIFFIIKYWNIWTHHTIFHLNGNWSGTNTINEHRKYAPFRGFEMMIVKISCAIRIACGFVTSIFTVSQNEKWLKKKCVTFKL